MIATAESPKHNEISRAPENPSLDLDSITTVTDLRRLFEIIESDNSREAHNGLLDDFGGYGKVIQSLTKVRESFSADPPSEEELLDSQTQSNATEVLRLLAQESRLVQAGSLWHAH